MAASAPGQRFVNIGLMRRQMMDIDSQFVESRESLEKVVYFDQRLAESETTRLSPFIRIPDREYSSERVLATMKALIEALDSMRDAAQAIIEDITPDEEPHYDETFYKRHFEFFHNNLEFEVMGEEKPNLFHLPTILDALWLLSICVPDLNINDIKEPRLPYVVKAQEAADGGPQPLLSKPKLDNPKRFRDMMWLAKHLKMLHSHHVNAPVGPPVQAEKASDKRLARPKRKGRPAKKVRTE